MAKRMPIVIDAEPVFVDAGTRLTELVPARATSVTTNSGKIIPRELFQSTRAQDVAEGFDTQTATTNMGAAFQLNEAQRMQLLQKELQMVQQWLNGFEPCAAGRRVAMMDPDGQAMMIQNFPLPDSYFPDYITLGVYTELYPIQAPIGLYLQTRGEFAPAIQRISRAMNVFAATGHHGAEPPMPGYQWVCMYTSGWEVDLLRPNRGQTIHKFLAYFFAKLNSHV